MLVMGLCFRCGMWKQGLLHDLSKYSYVEFSNGIHYWQGGVRSPNVAERDEKGYAEAWIHHKGRNKHHWQYWTDNVKNAPDLHPVVMPDNYFLESICDRIAACKNYNKSAYTDWDPLNYFLNTQERYGMHPEDAKRTEILLRYLGENGEEKALRWYKELYHQYKRGIPFTLS
ncbi:MAG: catalase [Erysipelotrichaceae bacterium]|nr:catalase [Erysipelotrichaceae bacterium]